MDLEGIAESLRRQRRDLDALIDDTSSRSIQTAELLARIEELRKRVESTRGMVCGPPAERPAE